MQSLGRRFVPRVESAADARSFVSSAVRDTRIDRMDALLLTSELVNNAIVHAQSEFVVRVGFTPSLLRIEVSDDSDAPPMVGRHQPAIHGLEMVDRLVPDWGYAAGEGGGKTVWAEVSLRTSE